MSTLGIVLLVVLILLLAGALPTWGYSRSWGPAPSGVVLVLIIVLIVLLANGEVVEAECAPRSTASAGRS